MTNCLSPSSIQGGWPRADIHPQVLPTPVPTLSNPCSSVTPEAAKRTWQAERGRERERGVEATSHLGSHFEPLPLLPPEHHVWMWADKPRPWVLQKPGGKEALSQDWDAGTPTQLP